MLEGVERRSPDLSVADWSVRSDICKRLNESVAHIHSMSPRVMLFSTCYLIT